MNIWHAAMFTVGMAFGCYITDYVWFKNWQEVCYSDFSSWPCNGLYVSPLTDLFMEKTK